MNNIIMIAAAALNTIILLCLFLARLLHIK